MKYTIQELEYLKSVLLMTFDENEMMDESYTNDYHDFNRNTNIFLNWLKKMESKNKIKSLLDHMK